MEKRRFVLRVFRPLLVRAAWSLTTHPGFVSPCADDHCIEVRNKARALGDKDDDTLRKGAVAGRGKVPTSPPRPSRERVMGRPREGYTPGDKTVEELSPPLKGPGVGMGGGEMEAVLDDLRDLLDVLGLPSSAQAMSPHEVMRGAIEKATTLQAENERLRKERDEARDLVERIVQAHPEFEKQVAAHRQALEGSE